MGASALDFNCARKTEPIDYPSQSAHRSSRSRAVQITNNCIAAPQKYVAPTKAGASLTPIADHCDALSVTTLNEARNRRALFRVVSAQTDCFDNVLKRLSATQPHFVRGWSELRSKRKDGRLTLKVFIGCADVI